MTGSGERYRCALGALLLAVATTASAAGPADWPLHGLDHANSRYSPLAQIDTGNVATLARRWTFSTGLKASFQATPVVVDGVMYVSTPFNHVLALDAATGTLRWRYAHAPTTQDTCCGPANRGVAVAGGFVYVATIDARVIALDAASGQVRWDVTLADVDGGAMEQLAPLLGVRELAGAHQTGQTGYSANMAPQVVDDLVLVGVTGAGYGLHVEMRENGRTVISVAGLSGEQLGRRGFLVALDAKTGAERWRWHAVPDSGWEGAMSPRTAYGVDLHRDLARERAALPRYRDAAQFGGGSIWSTPAIDRARGLLYIGTGNPAPQMDDATRPGDNLHTVSLVALELATGTLRWAYQQVPHDRWGYDVASPPVLFKRRTADGERDVVGQASKLGWLFIHDRESGELLARSEPFAPQENLFTPPSADGVRVTPATYGACSWSPIALDEGRQRAYVAGSHAPAMYYTRRLEPGPGQPWDSYTLFKPLMDEQHGLLTSIDLATGKLAWQVRTEKPMVGGVLATAGGLVFAGEGTGTFAAYATADGRKLWAAQASAGVNAPPVTYEIDGVQYVAVAAGGNSLYGYPVGDEIAVYALPAK